MFRLEFFPKDAESYVEILTFDEAADKYNIEFTVLNDLLAGKFENFEYPDWMTPIRFVISVE